MKRIFALILIGIILLSASCENDENTKPSGEQKPTTAPKLNENWLLIHKIQGIKHLSSFAEKKVANVFGIVTVVRSSYFYLQTPAEYEDADPRTSEGIKVYTGKGHNRKVGEKVLIDATVHEFRKKKAELSTTELLKPTKIKVLEASAQLPKPKIIGIKDRIPPTEVISLYNGNVEIDKYELQLAQGLDFWESLECMLVTIENSKVVSPVRYDSVFVAGDAGKFATGLSKRGSIVDTQRDSNPEIIKIKAGSDLPKIPSDCEVGDSLGQIIGVLDYDWGVPTIFTNKPIILKKKKITQEFTELNPDKNRLTVASFNVENLDPTDPIEKFQKLGRIIAQNLKNPDIVVLEEIQDNTGAKGKSTDSSAYKTFSMLVTEISAAGGVNYSFTQINPVHNKEGGEPRGNIRVGFLFNSKRVEFTPVSKDSVNLSTAPAKVVDVHKKPALSLNPGRIDPQNTCWKRSRPPLVAEFKFNRTKIFVIGVHFNSKGGDLPAWGHQQRDRLQSEKSRLAKAQVVKDFVDKIHQIDKRALVVVAGDYNDYDYSNPVKLVAEANLSNMTLKLPEFERYTHIYSGKGSCLDHILLSSIWADKAEFDIVHVNSEFADHASDHDPIIARIRIPN